MRFFGSHFFIKRLTLVPIDILEAISNFTELSWWAVLYMHG
jgi:hypothetical protein